MTIWDFRSIYSKRDLNKLSNDTTFPQNLPIIFGKYEEKWCLYLIIFFIFSSYFPSYFAQYFNEPGLQVVKQDQLLAKTRCVETFHRYWQ